jgi:hypothetical protein
MSLTVVAAGQGASLEPVNTPYGVSVVLANSGNGGTLYITEDTVSAPGGSFNFKTFFGATYKSGPLQAFWSQNVAGDTEAAKAFFSNFSFALYPILGGNIDPLPTLTVSHSDTKIMLFVDSPATTGAQQRFWRMEIQMKNSIGK